MKRVRVPDIPHDTSSDELVQAINDRLRRVVGGIENLGQTVEGMEPHVPPEVQIPDDVQAIGEDDFLVTWTVVDATRGRLDITYDPPDPVGAFIGVRVWLVDPTGDGTQVLGGDFGYNGDPEAVDEERYGTCSVFYPLPEAAHDIDVKLCSRSATHTKSIDETTPTVTLEIASVALGPPGKEYADLVTDLTANWGHKYDTESGDYYYRLELSWSDPADPRFTGVAIWSRESAGPYQNWPDTAHDRLHETVPAGIGQYIGPWLPFDRPSFFLKLFFASVGRKQNSIRETDDPEDPDDVLTPATVLGPINQIVGTWPPGREYANHVTEWSVTPEYEWDEEDQRWYYWFKCTWKNPTDPHFAGILITWRPGWAGPPDYEWPDPPDSHDREHRVQYPTLSGGVPLNETQTVYWGKGDRWRRPPVDEDVYVIARSFDRGNHPNTITREEGTSPSPGALASEIVHVVGVTSRPDPPTGVTFVENERGYPEGFEGLQVSTTFGIELGPNHRAGYVYVWYSLDNGATRHVLIHDLAPAADPADPVVYTKSKWLPAPLDAAQTWKIIAVADNDAGFSSEVEASLVVQPVSALPNTIVTLADIAALQATDYQQAADGTWRWAKEVTWRNPTSEHPQWSSFHHARLERILWDTVADAPVPGYESTWEEVDSFAGDGVFVSRNIGRDGGWPIPANPNHKYRFRIIGVNHNDAEQLQYCWPGGAAYKQVEWTNRPDISPVTGTAPPAAALAVTIAEGVGSRGYPDWAPTVLYTDLRATVRFPAGHTADWVILQFTLDGEADPAKYEEWVHDVPPAADPAPIEFTWGKALPVPLLADGKWKARVYLKNAGGDSAFTYSNLLTVPHPGALAANVVTGASVGALQYSQAADGTWRWAADVTWTNPAADHPERANFHDARLERILWDLDTNAAVPGYESTWEQVDDYTGVGEFTSRNIGQYGGWPIPLKASYRYRLRIRATNQDGLGTVQNCWAGNAAFVDIHPIRPDSADCPRVSGFFVGTGAWDDARNYILNFGFTAPDPPGLYSHLRIYAKIAGVHATPTFIGEVRKWADQLILQQAPAEGGTVKLWAISVDSNGRENAAQPFEEAANGYYTTWTIPAAPEVNIESIETNLGGDNMARNPSFERLSEGWPIAWTRIASNPANVWTLFEHATAAHSGIRYIGHYYQGGDSGYASVFSDGIDAIKDTKLFLSAQIYRQASADGTLQVVVSGYAADADPAVDAAIQPNICVITWNNDDPTNYPSNQWLRLTAGGQITDNRVGKLVVVVAALDHTDGNGWFCDSIILRTQTADIIPPQSLVAAQMAANLKLPELVATLPTNASCAPLTLNQKYPADSVVVVQSDKRMYVSRGTGTDGVYDPTTNATGHWQFKIAGTDIFAYSITAINIAASAIGTRELFAGEILVGAGGGKPSRFRVNDGTGSMVAFIGDNGAGFIGAYLINCRIGTDINNPVFKADQTGITIDGATFILTKNSIRTTLNALAQGAEYSGVRTQLVQATWNGQQWVYLPSNRRTDVTHTTFSASDENDVARAQFGSSGTGSLLEGYMALSAPRGAGNSTVTIRTGQPRVELFDAPAQHQIALNATGPYLRITRKYGAWQNEATDYGDTWQISIGTSLGWLPAGTYTGGSGNVFIGGLTLRFLAGRFIGFG